MTNHPTITPKSNHPRKKDRLFRALSKQRRRRTLRVLQQHQQASISEIAQKIALCEDGAPSSDGPSDTVTEIHIDLYHRHIPILAAAGLIYYVEERDVIAISEHGMNAIAYME